MPKTIEVVETKLFSAVVADEIIASINDSVSESGKCSLVLAGGKTPSVIYRTIAKPPRVSEIEWNKVQVYWGDERWVSRQDTQSNFKMVNETLLSFLPGGGPSVISVDTSFATAHECAVSYEAAIRESTGVSEGEIPVFDLVLLGVGEDGHTASIFPSSRVLDGWQNRDQPICAAVPGPGGEGWRITLSPLALFSAKKIIFIVRGEGKSTVLKKVLEGEADFKSYPAQLYREAKGKVVFFLDTAAAHQMAMHGG